MACLAVAAFLIAQTFGPIGDTRHVDRSIAAAVPVEELSAVVQHEGPSIAPAESDASPSPTEPTPVEPTPIEPTPVEPTPVEPTPVEPTPVEPTPVEPTPAEPTPAEPSAAERPFETTLVERVKALEDEAVSVAMRLIEEFPDSTDPLVLLGKVHNRNLNHAEAIRCWEQCVERNPKRGDAYDAIALAAYRMGDFEKAVAAGEKAIAVAPNMPGARVHLGQALLAMGKPQEAVAPLQQETQLAPDSAEAHFLLGQAHRQVKNDEQALSCYEKAIALCPKHTDAYYAMAALRARRGMPHHAAECRARFKELKTAEQQNAIDLDSLDKVTLKLAMTYCDAGQLYQGYGKLQQAEQHWLKAAAVDPRSVRSRKSLIGLYQKSNRTAEALVVCEQLRDILPENAELHAFFALLSAQSAQFDAAESAIRRAIELDQDNENYRRLNSQLQRRK